MNRRLFGLACTLILTASVSATGCGRYTPCPGAGQRPEGLSTKDLAGTFQSSAGRLALDDDGTFSTVGWPTDLGGATGDTKGRTGSGTWKLAAVNDPGWPVSFTFHKISGYWNSEVNGGYYGDGLYVSGSRENPHLYGYVGDPDSCELNAFTRES